MTLKEIEKTICIDPCQLDHNIENSILDRARQTWVGKCTKEDGYIISVERVIKIIANHIASSTASIVFTLRLLADVLVPEIGLQLEAKATTLLPQGIFCIAKGKLNILLPTAGFSDRYEFDRSILSYVCIANREEKISKGDDLHIEITAIRYEKNNFNCIGKLLL